MSVKYYFYMKNYQYIIIGAGASGLYLGQFLPNSLILERGKIGTKILASGGGNCNFTNKNITSKNYYSQNEGFVKNALDAFSKEGFLQYLRGKKLSWYEKTHGRMFLKQGGKGMLDVLLKSQKAQIKTDYEVKHIEKEGAFFIINKEYTTKNLIVATGGMSMGGTDFGLKVAKQFGLKIIQPYPALVRFDLEDEELLSLTGLSVQDVKSGGFVDGIVFTKKGIGGPLIYQISLYHQAGQEIKLDFSGCEHVPKRLRKLLNDKKELVIVPKKTAGFKFSEVMGGGVDTKEINSTTFMANKCEGLYFIGEVLDVTGNLGGYNLHFAWASADSVRKHFGF